MLRFVVFQAENNNRIEDLKKQFTALDKNNSGDLDYNEAEELFEKEFGRRESVLMLRQIDKDLNAHITLSEFTTAAVSYIAQESDSMIDAAFDRLDVNGDGKLNMDELLNGFFTNSTMFMRYNKVLTESMETKLKKFDADNDKMLNKEEFKEMITSITASDE